jgi:hypothetical protein
VNLFGVLQFQSCLIYIKPDQVICSCRDLHVKKRFGDAVPQVNEVKRYSVFGKQYEGIAVADAVTSLS